MSTTLGLKVDEETRRRLKALAEATDRTPHWLVKTALVEYLEREERAIEERREDDARWEHYALTGEAVPHEEVRGWLEALARGDGGPCPR